MLFLCKALEDIDRNAKEEMKAEEQVQTKKFQRIHDIAYMYCHAFCTTCVPADQ